LAISGLDFLVGAARASSGGVVYAYRNTDVLFADCFDESP